MTETKSYIENLFTAKAVMIDNTKQQLFDEFAQDEANADAVKIITAQQKYLVDKWRIKNRIADIITLKIPLPNATAGKPYQAKINFKQLGVDDLITEEWQGLEEIGLAFNKELHSIEGTPIQSGELNFKLIFKIDGQTEDSEINEKNIPLIINADPKTLWKDIPSNKEAIFWKEDDIETSGKIGEKHIVVASKRGRSHENAGSFRDDDFSFKHIEAIGWSIVAVSDGAGSYPLSRQGSQLACLSVIDYFENQLEKDSFLEFENQLMEYNKSKDENLLKEIEVLSKQNLYRAVLFAHHQIKDLAEETQKSNPELFNNRKAKGPIEYFHSTLIFALFKKFAFGYVIMTFGVGDCPIALMNKEQTETSLLNWLDVGEFGGGTRFVTQADIFHSKEHPMASRFNFKIIPDFSYLFLMTDGIYDPKFVVEANLEKHEKWIDFIRDLEGKNEDEIKVRLSSENGEIARQFSAWMDFWSAGNHDDRTMAIIF
ncbi:PP2C family serine/threonine-protein phosphatase [Pedobacter sp. UYP1]|uniref:PP2C family serine/threonine-protein phosphatase n=1 Tax=Pedobacter sp. UYP1 TaxID=1756396 RepID=UPI00339B3F26